MLAKWTNARRYMLAFATIVGLSLANSPARYGVLFAEEPAGKTPDLSPTEPDRLALAEMPDALRGKLNTACLDCHSGEYAEGGFDLGGLPGSLSDPNVLQKWVRVHDRIAAGEMPPPEDELLSDAERQELVGKTALWIRQFQLQRYAVEGRVRGRRLTNLQLERTLQDLLAIDAPLSRLLPAEPRVDGFVGLADSQAMSHFHLESHLSVVDAALDIAFERLADAEPSYYREFTPEKLTANRRPGRRNREPEMREGLAVVWSSGLSFYGRITPTRIREAGWYRIQLTASAVKPPKTGGVWCSVRSGLCVSSAPQLDWIGSFEATAEPKQRTYEAWLDAGDLIQIRPDDTTLKKARFRGGQVGPGEGEPQDVPGVALHRLSIERIYPNGDPDSVAECLLGPELSVQYNRRQDRLVLNTPEPLQPALRQLRRFIERAFRRPVSDAEARPYLKTLEQDLAGVTEPLVALRKAYRAVLCSPRFVYFVEPVEDRDEADDCEDAKEVRVAGAESRSFGQPLDQFAIANRLSYFFTGSMPDEPLWELAEQGKLRDPRVLGQQVDRLLQGDSGRLFVEDFAGQWLDLLDIDFTQPDPRSYRDFDLIVKHAMLEETHRFLFSLIRENAPIEKLVHAPFTFLNSRLARYYELDAVVGEEMSRVDLGENSIRGGLLSQGSVLKVTADGNNTSPVIRGVWISERILGVEIPPPPENVPAVEPDIRGATTIREQLQKHVADPVCAACHQKIDPPGYALENFDPAGQWREAYDYRNAPKGRRRPAIDASFTLSDGRHFEGFLQFRELATEDPSSLARCLATHLVTYGTAAKIAFADREPLQQIVDQASQDGYGVRSVIQAVVTSPLFLNK